MKNLSFILIALFQFTFEGCTISSTINFKKLPTEIVVYKLPQFNKYFISIKCNDLKKMNGITRITLNRKKEIKEFMEIFENPDNFMKDSIIKSIDSRILFEVKRNGKILKTYCWSNTKLIEFEGGVYRYVPTIDNYLMNNFGIIMKSKE